MEDLGSELSLDRVKRLESALPKVIEGKKIEGAVVSVDRFGNLVSNIHRTDLQQLGTGAMSIRLGHYTIDQWCDTYACGRPGEPMAVIGSRDCLEIAVNGASASDKLAATRGTVLCVHARDDTGAV